MNLNCCDYYRSEFEDDKTIKNRFTSSIDQSLESSANDLLPIESSNKSDQSFNDQLVRSIIQFIVTIYQRLVHSLGHIYYTILNYIFRTNYNDNLKVTDCSKNDRTFCNYKITDVPPHLRFNPFILEGYRSNLTFKQSLISLFYIHNETINVYSHAFAFIYFLIFIPSNLPWSTYNSNYLCLFFAINHVFSAIAPWFGSTIYHLFMNHRNGQTIYNKLLAFDVFGIWITQTFGALLPVYMSVIEFNFVFKYSYLALYLLLAIRSLYDVLIVGGVIRRRVGFSSLVLMQFISIYLRTYSNKVTNYDDLILQELYPILGAIISAYRIPEIFSPGTFDLFLNSHNIMHFLVVLATFHLHSSALFDLNLLSQKY